MFIINYAVRIVYNNFYSYNVGVGPITSASCFGGTRYATRLICKIVIKEDFKNI